MFKSISELVERANAESLPISAIMIRQEAQVTERSEQQVLATMAHSLKVMQDAVRTGCAGVRSHSGMTGMDAKKLNDYLHRGNTLTEGTFLKAVTYALAANEVNASMGLICATPTGGACGVLPGVLLAVKEKLNKADADVVRALFCAGAMGFVIANNAFISGAAGGCQAEVGSASAMAAAAAVELAGGTPQQCAHAMAMALKNMLGLACDPLAGLVEVPCIKRNAAGAANALAAAEMALAGIESYVPWDEVILAMYQIGLSMPIAIRETAQGGLADTPTGQQWKQLLWQPEPAEKDTPQPKP